MERKTYQLPMTDQELKEFLKANGDKGKDIGLSVVQLDAKSFVNKQHDDIELNDWAYLNNRAKIWFCSDISQSTILLNAISELLEHKCETKQNSGFIFRQGKVLKFLGFVSAATYGNKVETFHIKSFLLYETSSHDMTTVVHCVVTARHRFASNMQERLLQIMQMMQYRLIHSWNVRITSKCLNLPTLGDSSRNALISMNFRVVEKDNHFEALTSCLVPTVIYTNQTTWIKYGYDYTEKFVDKLPVTNLKNNATGLQRKLLDLLYSEYELFEELGVDTTSVSHSLSVECEKREVTLEGIDDNIAQLAEIFTSTATHLTRIPFSFFTHKLITLLKKHSMLEVTLQIMQQFEIQLKEANLMPNLKKSRIIGDKSMYCVRCKKCQQDISAHGDIRSTLKLAPAAMMKHMRLDFAHDNHWPILQADVVKLERCLESLESYSTPLCKESNDQFTFGLCEALKIDMNLQYGSDKDTEEIVTNTFFFLQVMFESSIPANEPAITEKEKDQTDTDDSPFQPYLTQLYN